MCFRLVLLLTAIVFAAGCSSADGEEESPDPMSAPPTEHPSGTDPTASGAPPSEPADASDAIQVEILAGTIEFTATLRDTAAARDLVAQLPVTISMRDHGRVEKTGPLPVPLATTGEPAGADPDPGDLGYYAPGRNLVLYYGDQGYYDGIVVLGVLHGDLDALSRVEGDVTVTVRSAAVS